MGFTLKNILHNKAKALLHLETNPGLGCSEPAAIGLSAAAAVALLKEKTIESIEVITDPNIYKNAMGVIIPGSEGQSGIPLAAAMGAVAGDPEDRLQVFSTIDKPGLEKAESLLKVGKVSAVIKEGQKGLYIRTIIKAGGHTAEAVIRGRHDHIESLSVDGVSQKGHPFLTGEGNEDSNVENLKQWLISLSIEEIVDLMFLARKHRATYSGVMRRINFPGSPMEQYGMISELEMARMVAVSRLVMGDVPRAHCTHEPHSVSLLAGANLFFPEVGASPRDGQADTGKGRGKGLEKCRQMHLEMDWDPDLPSNCFETAEDVNRGVAN